MITSEHSITQVFPKSKHLFVFYDKNFITVYSHSIHKSCGQVWYTQIVLRENGRNRTDRLANHEYIPLLKTPL